MSVSCTALIIGLSTIITGESRNAAFARCHLAAQVGSVPAGEYLPDCVRAAGYSDWCAVKTPGTIGVIPDCYRGSSLLTRWRDAIR